MKLSKILNVKAYGDDVKHNDSIQAVVDHMNDKQLKFLLEFADILLKLIGPSGNL